MITKMKKLTFLIYHNDYEKFLGDLRNLGVVHVAQRANGNLDDEELQESMKLSAKYSSSIKNLKALNEEVQEKYGDKVLGKAALEEVDSLVAEKNRLEHQLLNYHKEISTLSVWGDFDPVSVKKLEDSGYQVDFYSCTDKYFKQEWIDEYNATEINRIGSKIYFITITKKHSLPALEVDSMRHPALSLSQLKKNSQKTKKELDDIKKNLHRIARERLLSMVAAQEALHSMIELSKVKLNTEAVAGEKLMLMQGWVPIDKEPNLSEFLQSGDIYFEIEDPVPGDDVPIELNNKGLSKLFEPILRMYMLPKYNEVDLTPFFAPFFMIFFGLCLGDSGYGLFIVFAVTLYRIFAKNISDSMKPILSLVQILGTSTFFCGFLTGTFFGFNLYGTEIPFFMKMRDLFYFDNQWMFNLSLILGAVQIIFGMIIKAANKTIQFGFKYALSTIGWLIIILSTALAYLIGGAFAMGSNIHMAVLAVGAILAFFFNSPGKNIFLNFGLGLWDTYNMATGLLGDILSYVRLFALGLSGGILAGVFNSLAKGMSPDNVILGPIIMVVIFLIGHSINMFMNVLGAMVHPMRLTFVEFFKNSGYEGGGKEYKPFKM